MSNNTLLCLHFLENLSLQASPVAPINQSSSRQPAPHPAAPLPALVPADESQ